MKWSQWSPTWGMMRCGEKDLNTLMGWMAEIGKDASTHIKTKNCDHIIYGRKIYKDDTLEEVRFYCDTYISDQELDQIIKNNPRDIFYVIHKM